MGDHERPRDTTRVTRRISPLRKGKHKIIENAKHIQKNTKHKYMYNTEKSSKHTKHVKDIKIHTQTQIQNAHTTNTYKKNKQIRHTNTERM
jgi:hypothetical protein